MQDLQLTDEQIIEFKNAYREYAPDDAYPLKSHELGLVLRTLGYYPSDADLKKLIEEYDSESMGWIEIGSFLPMMAKLVKEPKVTNEDIRKAFRFFDKKSNGFVSAEEMRHILTEVGDCFTDEEMQEFLKYAMVDEDGQVNYEDFIARMMPKTEEKR